MVPRLGRLAVPAMASMGAGAIHAAAIGAHPEPRIAAITFTATAAFQLVWGITALQASSRTVALLGGLGNAGIAAGWVLARRGEVPIDGLDTALQMGVPDTIAAVLTACASLLALATAVRRPRERRPPVLLLAVSAGAIFVASATGMIGMTDLDHGADEVAVAPDGRPLAAIAPTPYDPAMPIDLGGVDGVSSAQQARAENLLSSTIVRLPQWSDPAVAEAAGFRSIGDGATGEEHYIHREFMANDTILDPDEPESLVFDTTVTPKKLVAAMYMLPPGTSLDTAPDIGGKLTQWHIHNNLCFTADGRVGGLTNAAGGCDAPLLEGPEQPMIHVWIVPHPCGPFAALEGIAGGQIKEGDTKLCDTAHGSH